MMTFDDVAAARQAVEDALRSHARRGANAPTPVGHDVGDDGAWHVTGSVDERRVASEALDEWIERTIADRMRAASRPRTDRDAGPRPRPFTEDEVDELRRTVLARVFGLGELQPLLDDDEVETIHINGAARVFVRDADGTTNPVSPLADGDNAELVDLVLRLAAHEGLGERRWDTGAPALNLTLRDGSRLHGLQAITRYPCLTIRKSRLLDVDLNGLVARGTVPMMVARLLTAAIQAGQSIVVAGGPGAGKSTTVRALASVIAPARRIVTIEDTLELHLDLDVVRHPDCVAIETRPPNTEGRGEITVTWALREALRMDPDVLIVGEVRIDETVPMLLALAAGNVSGSLSTVHAYSSAQALQQLQTYAMVGPDRMPADSSARLIGSAVDWIIHVERRPDRDNQQHRVVTSVREVCGSHDIQVRSNEVFVRHRNGSMETFPSISDDTRQRLLDVDYDIGELADAERFAR